MEVLNYTRGVKIKYNITKYDVKEISTAFSYTLASIKRKLKRFQGLAVYYASKIIIKFILKL